MQLIEDVSRLSDVNDHAPKLRKNNIFASFRENRRDRNVIRSCTMEKIPWILEYTMGHNTT